MTNVSVRELRQNPADMVRGLEAGESFTLTSYNRPIANIVPIHSSVQVQPPKRTGGADLSDLQPHQVKTASDIDALLDDMKGQW